MATLSKVLEMISWAFVPNQKDAKHLGHIHPIFSFMSALSITLYLSYVAADRLEKRFPHLKGNLPNWSRKKLAGVLLAYVALTLVSRYKFLGPVVFYDFLWACNVAILILAMGLFSNKPILVSSSLILIAIDQMLWYVDILGYFIMRKFPIGVAAFLAWPETILAKKLTTTHHLWFIPLAFYLLHKGRGKLEINSFQLSTLITVILAVSGRIFAPKEIMNGNSKFYLNINCAWEAWKDLPFEILHRYDDKEFFKMLPWNISIWNGGNFLFFLVLRKFFQILQRKLQKAPSEKKDS